MPDRPVTSARTPLGRLCADLARLREQAGGPPIRDLARQVGLGKSQVAAILSGRIRRLPPWSVVRAMVEGCYRYAAGHGRTPALSITGGLEEYWRPRYALVEHEHGQNAAEPPGEGGGAAGTGEADPVGGRPAPVPRQLPRPALGVVGRAAELADLTRAAGSGAGLLLVTGTAGVGKTTLALAWAYQLADRFPHGQLYVTLRGFDPDRPAVSPPQALRILLAGLGVPARDLPSGFDAQVGRYRSLLAGRRVLVVLDDARDAAQVRPLLPGPGPAVALVASRGELSGLVAGEGGYPLALPPLSPGYARELLVARLGPDRVAAEPAAVDRLVAAAGGLPVALTALAARAATRPGFPLASIALPPAATPAGVAAGDPVAATMWPLFTGSYRALADPVARLFRLLSAHPGPDVGVAAMASVAAVPPARAAAGLAGLAAAAMAVETRPGRYGLHDLWRGYARDLADPELDPARIRCLDHYLHTAVAAALRISPAREPIGVGVPHSGVVPEPVADRDTALAWFAAEHEVLLALVDHTTSSGADGYAWRLAWALADVLELNGQLDEWQRVQRSAVRAARRLPDPEPLARMLLILGNAQVQAGALAPAERSLAEAAELFRAAGVVRLQAQTAFVAGYLWERRGRYAEALGYARQALSLARVVGDPAVTARGHNGVGWCLIRLGRYPAAERHLRLALEGFRALGDRRGTAAVQDSLAVLCRGTGRYAAAVRYHRRALDLLQALGDRVRTANVLVELGDTYAAAGRAAPALRAWRRALAVYTELGHPSAASVRDRLPGPEPGRPLGGSPGRDGARPGDPSESAAGQGHRPGGQLLGTEHPGYRTGAGVQRLAGPAGQRDPARTGLYLQRHQDR